MSGCVAATTTFIQNLLRRHLSIGHNGYRGVVVPITEITDCIELPSSNLVYLLWSAGCKVFLLNFRYRSQALELIIQMFSNGNICDFMFPA